MAIEQPEWFFSSLAQVTAAIVGFLGGFVLLRLLEVMRVWRDLKEELEQRQTAWIRAYRREEDFDRVEKVKLGPFTGERLKLSQAESESWADFYRTLEACRRATLPRELNVTVLVLVGLVLGGALGPLWWLEHPAFGIRATWLLTLSLVFISIALLTYISVKRSYEDLKDFQLRKFTEGYLEHYELNMEAHAEREAKEQSDRES